MASAAPYLLSQVSPISILYPIDSSCLPIVLYRGSSRPIVPGLYTFGAKESGKLKDWKRGAFMAAWGSMPNTTTFRNTCTLVCVCVSPPGVPKLINSSPSLSAMLALGVMRGLLPGWRASGCCGSRRNWFMRLPSVSPVPGTMGVCGKSLGVSETALPLESTTQM